MLGDPGELRQAFLNLVINAKHAMPDGGTLAVDVHVAGDDVEIGVQDSGTGIAPQDLPKVFTRGFTTKTDQGGTGLGLPVCRDIVRRHDGTISVESDEGRGTAFTIRLPLPTTQEQESSERRPSVSDRTVLVSSEQ